jgi:hypothetical protein
MKLPKSIWCLFSMCSGTIDSFERDCMDRVERGVVWTCNKCGKQNETITSDVLKLPTE